jgi:predicted ABC-type ATPase
MPNVIVISGANGAGKSTLAPFLLRDTFGILEYVNADTIADGLSAFAPEAAAFDAGRLMLGRLSVLAADRKDFAFETTLASRSYARRLSGKKNHDVCNKNTRRTKRIMTAARRRGWNFRRVAANFHNRTA